MDLTKILDWIKLSPKYLAAIAIFAGLLLFAPRSITETLGLFPIVEQYRTWIGLAFFLTVALLGVHVASWVFDSVKERWNLDQIKRMQIKYLHKLTNEEKAVLRGYILQKSRTQLLDYTDGVVSGLEGMSIIYRATTMSQRFNFAYNIQVWIYDYLQKHQELIAEN